MYRMNTEGTDDMQSLINIEEGEEEEDFDDDPELIPADDEEETKAPPLSRKHKETIDYSTKITKWQDRSVQEDDIRFQLFLRGIELTPEQEEEITKHKVKGKGRNQTRKDYLINYIDSLIKSGKAGVENISKSRSNSISKIFFTSLKYRVIIYVKITPHI